MPRVVLAALPGLLALVCTVIAVAALAGWPWALLACVPFLLVADNRATARRRPAAGLPPIGGAG